MKFLSSKKQSPLRRPLTLLEVLGALFLAGILLSTVLHFFKEYSFTQAKLKLVKETVLERSYLQLRLNQVLSTTENEASIDTYEQSTSNALFFDLPEESKGIVYLNKKNALILKIKEEEEVLLENISEATLLLSNNIFKLTLKCKKEKEPLIFSFFLPCDKKITYNGT